MRTWPLAGSQTWECTTYTEARALYCHIHARYIVTSAGMTKMVRVAHFVRVGSEGSRRFALELCLCALADPPLYFTRPP